MMVSEKYCGGCKQNKAASAFWKNSKRPDGLAIQCKDCYRSYYVKCAGDPEIVARKKAKKKAWYARNRDKRLAEERSRDQGRKRQQRRESYARNPEPAKARMARWIKENPEKFKANQHARRARKKAAAGRFTAEDIKEIFAAQRGRCAVCAIKIKGRRHIDHITALKNGGTNDRRNLQILCVSCNTSKSDRDPIEFMQSRGRLL